ncbi:MAG: DUF58 domain-containing protein, partial [Deltaproteobacteria bacterium]
RGKAPLEVAWVDSTPLRFDAEGDSGRVQLAERSELRVTYRVEPMSRGRHRFGELHLRLRSPWGLCWRPQVVPLPEEVRVYPNLEALRGDEVALLERLGIGSRKRRRQWVEGREFDSLREYRSGDDFRRIDWKATARRGHPVVRDFRPEQNQDVILMIDCGRHMRPRVGRATRLDLAVDTALCLARTALERGDHVGLVVFSHRLEAWLPPDKGREQLLRVVEMLYAAEPTLTESDYHAAFDSLQRRALRRALVVAFTDQQGEDSSSVLLSRTLHLRPRHLPVVVTIADEALVAAAHRMPERAEEAWERIAAEQLVAERRAITRRLRSAGAWVVDVPASRLSAATVGAYLEVKARGAL